MRWEILKLGLFLQLALCAGFLQGFYFKSLPQSQSRAIKLNPGRGWWLIVPQRVADALPLSTEANFCQFKAERRRSDSCFSFRVERDGTRGPGGKKNKSIHLRSFMAKCGKSIGKKSIAQLLDCIASHRSVRSLPLGGVPLGAANRDKHSFCQQSRIVLWKIEPTRKK